jgi:CRP-like cAMP-binding protein
LPHAHAKGDIGAKADIDQVAVTIAISKNWSAAANQPTGMSDGGRGRPKVTHQNQHYRNRLLAALLPRDFALLEPHLQIVPIARGEFLHLPGDEIEQVYFLHSGIVSLMAISEDGNAISTASVGSEGAIGTIAGTGFVRAFTRALVQVPGVASKISVLHLRRAVSKSEAISDLITRYHMALMCKCSKPRCAVRCMTRSRA